MKKIVLVLCIACCGGGCAVAQSLTLQEKLFFTCKVWGFVKYYHSNVSSCGVNWDSVLIAGLPLIEAAADDSSFSDALDSLLLHAGPMTLSTSYFPDTLPAALKRNRDWSWIVNPDLRADVQVQLDTIKNNFRPHAECWVTYGTTGSPWLLFPYDNPMLNVNTATTYPDEYHRLLLLFKFWNVINYFDPYTYVFDKPMDTILFNNVMQIDTVSSAPALYMDIRKITSGFDDGHVEGLTISGDYPFTGSYSPQLALQYIQGEYVVVKSGITVIPVGDAILSVNGLAVSQWEDSLGAYLSAGNSAMFHREMCNHLLEGSYAYPLHVTFADTTGATDTATILCTLSGTSGWFPLYYYPADSLNTIEWTTMDCGVGYVNFGNLPLDKVGRAYDSLRNAPAIIFDLRNYPDGALIWTLADLMYPAPKGFVDFTIPDDTYPGTSFWADDSLGTAGNPTPYGGTVIILFNGETVSQAEFSCMALSAMPKVVKIGSQTDGTDGNTSDLSLTQDISSGFTTLGVYYPNGDSTERIGIVPDSVVTPTIAGIIQGRDEVLNKALQVGCSVAALSTPKVLRQTLLMSISPNPAADIVNIEASNIPPGNITLQVRGIAGDVMLQEEEYNSDPQLSVALDISCLPAGIYLVSLTNSAVHYVSKLVKN